MEEQNYIINPRSENTYDIDRVIKEFTSSIQSAVKTSSYELTRNNYRKMASQQKLILRSTRKISFDRNSRLIGIPYRKSTKYKNSFHQIHA